MKKGLKNTKRKNTMQMLINNNARFCSLCIWKLSSQTFLECKYKQQQQQQQQQQKNSIDEELKSESDNDTDTNNEE